MSNFKRPAYRTLPLYSLSILILFVVGCSEWNNPASSQESSSTQTENNNTGPESPYPPITEADLEQLLPAGFRALTTTREHYGTLDDQSSRRLRRNRGGTVTHRNNGVEIGPWQLWSDETITVSTPVPGRAVVDFYPHPYQFNGCIRLWIDLNSYNLPPGRRWDEVAFFYADESGRMIRYWGAIDLNAMTYSIWPDHFSRYILAMPGENGNGGD
jgi:hypothetical protein